MSRLFYVVHVRLCDEDGMVRRNGPGWTLEHRCRGRVTYDDHEVICTAGRHREQRNS